jgi:hypothetical protein
MSSTDTAMSVPQFGQSIVHDELNRAGSGSRGGMTAACAFGS